jgi:hypothetical protein
MTSRDGRSPMLYLEFLVYLNFGSSLTCGVVDMRKSANSDAFPVPNIYANQSISFVGYIHNALVVNLDANMRYNLSL